MKLSTLVIDVEKNPAPAAKKNSIRPSLSEVSNVENTVIAVG
jgi:hypothetical protein